MKNVLVACEESQVVCKAFLEKGFNAFSCDLQKPSGKRYDRHIYGDCLPLLNGNVTFKTMDGELHTIDGKWDLIIAHPPCTYLARSGACNIPKDFSRIEKGWKAKEFFMKCYNADCEHICVENPIPLALWDLPPPSQWLCPSYFGEDYTKKTGLWLKGLPPLFYGCKTVNASSWLLHTSWAKTRSKTFDSIAKAMANQWEHII